jgi:hypothetical protein
MAAIALTSSVTEPTDLAAGFGRRVMSLLKAQVEDWQDTCSRLTRWEEQNLVDELTPKKLAEHAMLLDWLEKFGVWFSVATQKNDFPDREMAEAVAITLQDLKDRRAIWHGQLKPEQRKEILHTVFNES